VLDDVALPTSTTLPLSVKPPVMVTLALDDLVPSRTVPVPMVTPASVPPEPVSTNSAPPVPVTVPPLSVPRQGSGNYP